MALLKCITCGGNVADDAICCPHCGHRAQLMKYQEVKNKLEKIKQEEKRKKDDQEAENKKINEKRIENKKKIEQSETWKNAGLCPICGHKNLVFVGKTNVDEKLYLCRDCDWHALKLFGK